MTGADIVPKKRGRPPVTDAERDRLWDAARAEFCQHGLRQASIAAIARRAGVSQPTLYRRCGTKDDIASAVILREVIEAFGRLEAATKELATAEERMIEAFILGVQETRTNDLVRALRDYDPDVITGGIFRQEDSRSKLLRSTIAAVLNDATIAEDAAQQAVELVIRIIATLLMAPTPVLPLETDDQARALAEKYFVPLIEAARRGPL
ncbi:TetR/AcrR family transcriptional regulator [Mycobacteroides abscessus]|uniref:TetR/AcrR family transcriptional regulator n=1 Tax=Mycobacteroides abscessus TaxID=36809 RepID=UPI000C25CE33|nr:TetR/AcrR family transcriptional regulator [Mycobacteroides abscessus]MBN7437897.1 TetR/AcrR family transcriptional regulator [Mycobacteroides abscessus subsp. abscessus]MDM1888396.1 TetR/AcrR family transcriptional regulator [Mycobacteroides abscessus]MDM1893182.1 TetR/AcrR family transcriptional regulator [Mycobacteroides abscessus]MDO3110982.1 TetR/AcrR family transcriptional regulator [Mycobacteroides abscessus subsp. abscessus]RIS00115.1 TetR/AcrR family transcriptional regulator [Myco